MFYTKNSSELSLHTNCTSIIELEAIYTMAIIFLSLSHPIDWNIFFHFFTQFFSLHSDEFYFVFSENCSDFIGIFPLQSTVTAH